jgi:hypothetical protein
MKKITPLILLIFISLILMISIGCSILGGSIFGDSSRSTITSGGGGSGEGGGGGGGSEGGDYPKRKIAFENLSNNRIYIVNEDGTNLTLLDNSDDNPNVERWPNCSFITEQGKYKIVFTENDQLVVINENSTGKQILTTTNYPNYFPMYPRNANLNLIAFIRVLQPGNYGDLFIIDPYTLEERQFTITSDLPVEPLIINPPMWTPNVLDPDPKITFLRDPNKDGHFDIYLLSTSNGQITQLTNTGDVISYAPLSRYGGKIAYVRNINGNWDIFVMDINTRQEYQITNTPEQEYLPAWSPIYDNKLLFIRNVGNITNPNGDIFIADIDISNPQNPQIQIQAVVDTDKDEKFAVWSPDGNKIAFIRTNSPADSNIIVKDLTRDTDNETNLTRNLTGIVNNPSWTDLNNH